MGTGVPAVVMAGDRGAARAVYGESKVFLEVAGRALANLADHRRQEAEHGFTPYHLYGLVGPGY